MFEHENKWTGCAYAYAMNIRFAELKWVSEWVTSVWRLLLSERRCHKLLLAWFASFFHSPHITSFAHRLRSEIDWKRREKLSKQLFMNGLFTYWSTRRICAVVATIWYVFWNKTDIRTHIITYAFLSFFFFFSLHLTGVCASWNAETKYDKSSIFHVWHAQALIRCNPFVPCIHRSSTY